MLKLLTMKKYDYIIAIDPDCEKSGYAILDTKIRKMTIVALNFPAVLDAFYNLSPTRKANTLVVVEAGWLNTSHWHLKKGDSGRMAATKGNAVGRNHETGRKLVEMAKHIGLEVKEIKPLKKVWKGKDGKITHDELSYFIPGLAARSNQEMRDAALIAWVEAGLPIRVKSTR